MFQQLKAAFTKVKATEAPSEVVQREPIGESQPTAAAPAPTPPTVPVIDGGTFESAESQVDPVEQKVLKFIRICHLNDGLVVKEIASGCDLPIADVQTALASLIAKGTVTHSGEPDSEANKRRYNLANFVPEPLPAPVTDRRSDEQKWSDEIQRKFREEEAAKQPPPAKRYEPTPEEVQAAVAAEHARHNVTFTEEQQRELKLMEGRRTGLNPQVAIKR